MSCSPPTPGPPLRPSPALFDAQRAHRVRTLWWPVVLGVAGLVVPPLVVVLVLATS